MRIVINNQDYVITGGTYTYAQLMRIAGFHEFDRPTIVFDNNGYKGSVYDGGELRLADGMRLTIR